MRVRHRPDSFLRLQRIGKMNPVFDRQRVANALEIYVHRLPPAPDSVYRALLAANVVIVARYDILYRRGAMTFIWDM